MKIFFDGGSRPNPGRMESAVVARGQLFYRDDQGEGSSHQAEWEALLHALDVGAQLKAREILLLGDNKAVIDQAKGQMSDQSASGETAQRYHQALLPFAKVRLRYVKRTQNLAGIALGHRRNGSIGQRLVAARGQGLSA